MQDLNEAARRLFKVPSLRPFQEEIMVRLLTPGPQRLLAIMPTGSGKTLCFSLPGLLLPGPTLVIYPLRALMADQFRRFSQAGLPVGILQGGQTKEYRAQVFLGLAQGRYKFILTNPESLGQKKLLAALSGVTWDQVILDEVHCVSEWGLSFRPAYLDIKKALDTLKYRVLAGFTATAGQEVRKRIQEILFKEIPAEEIIGNPDRPNIHYHHWKTVSRRWALEECLRIFPKPAVVFCRTRDACRHTALMLTQSHPLVPIRFFHAGLTQDEKKDLQAWFFNSTDGVLCATKAFGLGVDKNGIRSVIHWDPPDSLEDYLQESGRGGRDGLPCFSIILDDQTAQGEFIKKLRIREGCLRTALLQPLGWTGERCDACGPCRDELLPEFPPFIPNSGYKELRRLSLRQIILLFWGRKTHETERLRLNTFSAWGSGNQPPLETLTDLIKKVQALGIITLKKRKPLIKMANFMSRVLAKFLV